MEKSNKYKGVYFNKPNKKWMAYTRVNGKLKYLGLHETEELAAEASIKGQYNKKQETDKVRLERVALAIFAATVNNKSNFDNLTMSIALAKDFIQLIDKQS